MASKTTVNTVSSFGAYFLTTAFFVAKVTGYINWPWVWVFAPIWIPLVIGLSVVTILGLLYIVSRIFDL